MSLYRKQISRLRRIIDLAENLIVENEKSQRNSSARSNVAGSRKSVRQKRVRRTGKDLVQFRKMLKAQRKRGASVADLARKHHISTAYIYTL
jgi:hypothetical protein